MWMFWPSWIFKSAPHLRKSIGVSLKIGFKLEVDPGEQTYCELILCEMLNSVVSFHIVYAAFKWTLGKYHQRQFISAFFHAIIHSNTHKITLKLTQNTHLALLNPQVYWMTLLLLSLWGQFSPITFKWPLHLTSESFWHFDCLGCAGTEWCRREGGEERM